MLSILPSVKGWLKKGWWKSPRIHTQPWILLTSAFLGTFFITTILFYLYITYILVQATPYYCIPSTSTSTNLPKRSQPLSSFFLLYSFHFKNYISMSDTASEASFLFYCVLPSPKACICKDSEGKREEGGKDRKKSVVFLIYEYLQKYY